MVQGMVPGSARDLEAPIAKRRKLSPSEVHAAKLLQQPHDASKQQRSKKQRFRPRPPRENRSTTSPGQPRSRMNVSGKSNAADKTSSRPLLPEADDTVERLSSVKSLIDKIWIRNKNQHRTQNWWKHLSYLRKAINNLVGIEEKAQVLKSQAQVSGGSISAQTVRKRFEHEAQLRTVREVWSAWIRGTLVPKAYLGFSGLVADTQFANLGVVLLGILADIMNIVGPPKPNVEIRHVDLVAANRSDKARVLLATSLRVTGTDSGEVVERQYDSDDVGEVIERRTETSEAHPGSPSSTEVVNSPAMAEPQKLGRKRKRTWKRDEAKHAVREQDLSGTVDCPADSTIQHSNVVKSGKVADTLSAKTTKRVTTRSGTAGKLKDVKPRASGQGSKGKSAIDDLFAGLA